MNTSHYTEDAVRLKMDMAYKALTSANREDAQKHFHNILLQLTPSDGNTPKNQLLITAAMELSNLNFLLGKGFKEVVPFLLTGLAAAEQLGDQRSHALLHLHLGRLYYFSNQRQKAMSAFEEGKKKVEELGDEDILTQAAEFIGLYFYVQGLFRQAVEYFEIAIQKFEAEQGALTLNPLAPMWLGYCTAYLGQYHRAIGVLDYYRRLSMERGDDALAVTLRATLGIVLLQIGKTEEGGAHLFDAIKYAQKIRNSLATYFARGGIAYYYFLEGDIKACHTYLSRALKEGTKVGLVRQYSSPIFLEMGFALYKAGFSLYADGDMQLESLRIIQETNLHLRGTFLRLVAIQKLESGGDIENIKQDLQASIDCLTVAGAPVQLAKTRFEMIRILLKTGEREKARQMAHKAWKDLSGYGKQFYPDDLRPLLPSTKETTLDEKAMDNFFTRFIDIIQDIMPEQGPEALLARIVRSTNRYFGAERGALLWFADKKQGTLPELRAACNITEKEIFAEDFRSNLALIFKSFQENRLQMVQGEKAGSETYKNKAVLCLPFTVKGEVRGVLYHDNSYLPDCFAFLTEPELQRLVPTLGTYVELAYGLRRELEGALDQASKSIDPPSKEEIVGSSAALNEVLYHIEKIAATDSTVLILGETGVGKELMASRIHEQSCRSERSMVLIDPTTIPENLIESELFGHEKGAFTGADRQKKGRIELAHKSTLFIDEIGEIPLSVQVKLLRTIQDKTFVRIGGTKPITSDFRLIVATNRDLAEEVAAGRFREDLYYRLNVIPLTVPPLRERKKDILRLARHFIKWYALRYNRPELDLDDRQEAALTDYSWPGNIRELKNTIERAVLLATGNRLALDLPTAASLSAASDSPFADMPTLDEIQRRYIMYVLKATNDRLGGTNGAAAILGINRTTLYSRMKKIGLR